MHHADRRRAYRALSEALSNGRERYLARRTSYDYWLTSQSGGPTTVHEGKKALVPMSTPLGLIDFELDYG